MTDELDPGTGSELALELEHEADHVHDANGDVVALADGPAIDGAAGAAMPTGGAPRPDLEPGDASLLALVDRLGSLLDRSELSELAVEAGRTRLVLRKPVAIAAPPPRTIGDDGAAVPAATGGTSAGGGTAPAVAGAGGTSEAPAKPSVKAPLTGVWYSSPAPGSAPFVAAGREVAVGQVIGLIEAMKLFNEIKSDLAGRVVRVVPDSGSLVKAKQPLIEVEPL